VLSICLLAPLASADLVLWTNAEYTNRISGATFSDSDADFTGSVSSIVAAPTVGGLDVTSAVAESNESGTFWSSARAGGLDPYLMESFAYWEDIGTRTAETAVVADVTGATLEIIDFGSFFGMDLLASFTFEVYLDFAPVYFREVTLSGRGGFGAGGAFSVSPDGEPATYTLQPSGYYSSVRYTLDPLTIPIDLSGIAVGDGYDVRFIATTRAANAGGETAASAWFRDPVTGTGGVSIRYLSGVPTTVPEPASLTLLGVGVLALAGLRKRRRGDATL
jgi:hypothetical protein